MLEKVDLTKKVAKQEYKAIFSELQYRLRAIQKEAREAGIPVVIVFEGWDAAGKGTNIHLLIEKLDPRGFKVYPIMAPLVDELYRPFLWRFWIKLPNHGEMAIFDRSWYGRVLVERVEKLTPKEDWQRAYQEINDFERQLVDDGTVLVKCWLHISRKEQAKRFKACERDPLLRWKVSKEDWRHHKEYKQYLKAVEEMLERTSTHYAPWTIIEAHDARFSHVKMFKTIIEVVEAELRKRGAKVPPVAPQKPVAVAGQKGR